MRRFLTFGLLAAWVLSSCQKDVDQIVTTTSGPNTTWYANIPDSSSSRALKSELKLSIPEDSVTIFATGTTAFNTGPGSNLFFAIGQGALTQGSGAVYSGKAYISTRLIKSKGDIIRMSIPTDAGGSLLISSGAIYVSLTDSLGVPLSVTPGRNISFNYPDINLAQAMKVFHGEQTGTGVFNWLPATDSILNYVSTIPNAYLVYTNKLGWINNANYHDNITTTPPQTQIAIELPSYYTNANSIVYASFDNFNSVIELTGDAVTRQFRSGNVPVGRPVKIIVMSKQAGSYFMGTAPTLTATAPQGYQTVTVNPTITSFNNIESYLSTL